MKSKPCGKVLMINPISYHSFLHQHHSCKRSSPKSSATISTICFIVNLNNTTLVFKSCKLVLVGLDELYLLKLKSKLPVSRTTNCNFIAVGAAFCCLGWFGLAFFLIEHLWNNSVFWLSNTQEWKILSFRAMMDKEQQGKWEAKRKIFTQMYCAIQWLLMKI